MAVSKCTCIPHELMLKVKRLILNKSLKGEANVTIEKLSPFSTSGEVSICCDKNKRERSHPHSMSIDAVNFYDVLYLETYFCDVALIHKLSTSSVGGGQVKVVIRGRKNICTKNRAKWCGLFRRGRHFNGAGRQRRQWSEMSSYYSLEHLTANINFYGHSSEVN